MESRTLSGRLGGLIRPAAALLSGGLLLLASPPFDWWPLAFISLVPLWWAIREAPPRRAFSLGLLAGMLYTGFASELYIVLRNTTGLPPIARFLVTLLIAAWQGLVLGIWAGSVSLLAGRFRVSRLLAAPLVMVLAESAIPYLFKWYLSITAWKIWPLMQVAELGGAVAVSAMLVLASGVAAELLTDLRCRRRAGREALAGLLLLLVVIGAGYARGVYVIEARTAAPKLSVGLVQTGTQLYQEAEPEVRRQKTLQALGRSTTLLLARGTDLVIWPETVWPETLPRLQPGEPGPRFLRTLLTGFDGRLLFGAATRGEDGSHYNSALLMAASGQVQSVYDKNRLIPVFEYLPLADRWPQLARAVTELMARQASFHSGQGPTLVTDGDLRLGVLICNEEILPGYAAAVARLKPNLLVGIASDLWLVDTAAPEWHTANSVMRAVEARRDYVHVVEAGMSVLVDATGRVQAVIDAQETPDEPAATLTAEAALLDISSPGPYAVALFPWACLLTLVLAALRGQQIKQQT